MNEDGLPRLAERRTVVSELRRMNLFLLISFYLAPGGYLVFDDATISSCLGATEVVENLAIRRDGLNSEQVFPHVVFRAKAS